MVGVVGTTAIFLVYPYRGTIRQLVGNVVSLSTEVSDEDSGMTDMAPEQPVSKDTGSQEVTWEVFRKVTREVFQEVTQEVTLRLRTPELFSVVHLWQGKDAGYFFLPAYADQADCEISIFTNKSGSYMMFNGKRVEDGDVLSDIDWEQGYSWQMYDKQDNLLFNTEVVFCTIKNLPAIFIDTQSGNLQAVHNDIDHEEAGQLDIHDMDGNTVYQGRLDWIRGRGNTSWAMDKKPYQIKLDRFVDLFGFGEADEWNLLANGHDDTQFRNMLVFHMGEQAGLDFVPQGIMVSLYVNGNYQGNYYFCEKIEIEAARIAIGSLEDKIRPLYQQTKMNNLEVMESEDGDLRWVDMKYNPEDISGGYLISRDLPFRYEEKAVCGFRTDQGDCYEIISPKYASFEQVSYIANLMQELHDAAESDDGIHPRTGKHYTEYLDRDSFVDKYLVEEITKNFDGGATSSYFYKPPDSESTKVFAGPIWDYDLAFGNNTQDSINSNPAGITMLYDHRYSTGLFRDLYRQPGFRDAAIKRYQETYRGILETLIEEQVSEYDRLYGKAVRYNNIRWRSMYNQHRYYADYENNIRYLKYFMESRKQFLDDIWVRDMVYHCISFYVDDIIWRRTYVKDGHLPGPVPVPLSDHLLFRGFTVNQDGGAQYDEYRPIYCDMNYYAQWTDIPAEDK